MTMPALVTVAQFVGCVYLVWHAFCSAWSMSSKTNHGIRLGVIFIGTGALHEAMAVLVGHVPDWAEVITITGLCLITFFNQRASRCPCIVYHPERCDPDCECTIPGPCLRKCQAEEARRRTCETCPHGKGKA